MVLAVDASARLPDHHLTAVYFVAAGRASTTLIVLVVSIATRDSQRRLFRQPVLAASCWRFRWKTIICCPLIRNRKRLLPLRLRVLLCHRSFSGWPFASQEISPHKFAVSLPQWFWNRCLFYFFYVFIVVRAILPYGATVAVRRHPKEPVSAEEIDDRRNRFAAIRYAKIYQ